MDLFKAGGQTVHLHSFSLNVSRHLYSREEQRTVIVRHLTKKNPTLWTERLQPKINLTIIHHQCL